MTVLLLGALVLLAGGRLLFFAFGFQSDRPWQFVLFLLIFLVLEELFSLFKSRLFPLLLRLFRPEGFLQLILCRSMAETLMVLGILLLLRHLPGIQDVYKRQTTYRARCGYHVRAEKPDA